MYMYYRTYVWSPFINLSVYVNFKWRLKPIRRISVSHAFRSHFDNLVCLCELNA